MTKTSSRLTVDDVKRRLDRGEKVTFINTRNPIAWTASKVKVPGAVRDFTTAYLRGGLAAWLEAGLPVDPRSS